MDCSSRRLKRSRSDWAPGPRSEDEVSVLLRGGREAVCKPGVLRGDAVLVDATFLVQGRTFRVHRAILAASSSYFLSLFTSGTRDGKPGAVVELEDMDAEAFEIILDHIYAHEFTVTRQSAVPVLIAADRLQLLAAKEACAAFLARHVEAQNVWSLADLALQYNCQQLLEATDHFSAAQSSEALARVATASETAFTRFLQREVLCERELNIFRGCLTWAQRGGQQGAAGAQLARVLQHVRFPTMSPAELLEVEATQAVPQELLLEAYRWAALDQESRMKLPASPRTVPRQAFFLGRGVMRGLDVAKLFGWKLWFQVPYDDEGSMPPLHECPGSYILVGSMDELSEPGTLHLAAMGEKTQILGAPPILANDMSTSQGLVEVNGTYWYFGEDSFGAGRCFGFSAEPSVCLWSADTLDGWHRLSWHLDVEGRSDVGYRSGARVDLDSPGWSKVVYYAA